MIRTIIKREFLDNILSFRFVACVLVAIILVIISTTFLTNDYKDRLKDYNVGVAAAKEALTKVPVYSYIQIKIFKKPNPLSIFVSGIERETGNYVEFNHRDVPASLRGGSIKNEFSYMFSFFDLSSVIVIIFSLLALLLSYDSISGEKEDGTLSLALANSIPRYKFLLGKYLGMLISITVPLAFLFLLGILLLLFSKDVEVSPGFFSSMSLLFIFSIIYLSSVLLVGIFVSSKTRSSFASLLCLLTFYLATVFLMPMAVNSFAEKSVALKANYFEKNVQSVVQEKDKKIHEGISKFRQPRSWIIPSGGSPQGGMLWKRINSPTYLEWFTKLLPIREKLWEDCARKINNLRKRDDDVAEGVRRFQNKVLAAIPPSNFERASGLLAETGDENVGRFVKQLGFYWEQYVRYLDDKNAFGLRYFYPYPEEFSAKEKELVDKINKDYMEGKPTISYQGKYLEEALNYNPEFRYLDLSDLPVFVFHDYNTREKIGVSFFSFLILLFYNISFFALSHFSFNNYDPRREV